MISKLVSLSEAVSDIPDSSSITFSGVSMVRVPMKFIKEMIRQGKRDLYLIDREPGIDFDILIAAGAVRKVRYAMLGFELFGLALNFRRAVEKGEIEHLEDTCGAIVNGFRAGAYGLPFMPVKGIIGSDLVKVHEREGTWKVVNDPFDGREIVLVKAIQPDYAVIHVQKADEYGNASIEGARFEDVYKAKAAKNLIITAEEIIDTNYFRENPDKNIIPYFYTKYVVHLPKGAYPTACPNYYEADYDEIMRYVNMAREGRTSDYIKYWLSREV